jgi:Type II secretion system (T2SS), protein E, N-terminal domain
LEAFAVDDHFESETMFNNEQRVEPGGERTEAMETAQSWDLRYLDDEAVVIDSESATRVGAEELSRIGAAPVRCGDGNVRVVLADATPERIAAVREHFSGTLEIAVVTASKLASLLDAASLAVVSGPETSTSDAVTSGAAAAAPVWGRTLERVLGLFDTEATRLQELRGKLQELGGEMAARERRVQELETELQQIRVERLRDQEAVDRLRHELSDRNSRLERALSKTQELAAIIQGGHLR